MRANVLKNRCLKLAVGIVLLKTVTLTTLGGLSLFVASASAAPTSIESVRVRQSPERTRIVFDLSQPVEHRIFSLANPRRLVIDIEDAGLNVDISDVVTKGTPITGLRAAVRDNKDLRVVLDLSKRVKPSRLRSQSHFAIWMIALVIDLYTEEQQVAPVVQKAQSNLATDERCCHRY